MQSTIKKQFSRFDRTILGFALGVAAFTTLATFPVVAWHYWTTLTGFALLAIAGLAFADFVLWYCAVWSSTTRSGWIKYTALAAKILLSLVMIFNAAVVVFVMRGDHLNEQAAVERSGELETRQGLFAKCLKDTGDKRGCRELLKMPEKREQGAEKAESEIIPAWYQKFGIYIVPTLFALLVGSAVYFTAMVHRKNEGDEHQLYAALPPDEMFSTGLPGAVRHARVWRGGQVVSEPAQPETRPN